MKKTIRNLPTASRSGKPSSACARVSGLGLSRSSIIFATLALLSPLSLAQEQEPQTRRFDPAAGTGNQADNQTAVPDSRPSFARIFRAENEGSYHLRQVRRILDGEDWLALSEELWSGGENGNHRFRLTLDEIEGRSLSDADLADRSDSFDQRAPFLHLHGSFRVHDPELAELNYTLIGLGPGQRLDRPVQKVVVIPKQVGNTPWVLELDQETGYPLYRAEYDFRGQVVSILEVVAFEHGVPATPPANFQWWQETRVVNEYQDLSSAMREFSGNPVTPDANSLPSGYEISNLRVVDEDLNDEQTLVQTFTNGVDEIFLLATANATRPQVLQGGGFDDDRQVSLMVFEDQSTTQLMFFKGNLRYQIMGRSNADQLESFARSLIRKAYR